MSRTPTSAPPPESSLFKTPTGIQGFDDITAGGLPTGRTSLMCGGPGCGKTLFGIEFLLRGILDYGEPGLFVTFEETPRELAQNVASLGYDLNEMCEQGRLVIDHVQVERSEIEETGEYDLEGLFIRLGFAIDRVQAKRVVLDTLESLFASLPNEGILRAELRRLFHWLKARGVTTVITAERGSGTLTRHGLEEYVSDCVILLDHRVVDQVSTRRLRVVKYRGSVHGTNEYPFLIDDSGISVFPITSLGLEHEAGDERVSTGVPRLDTMLGGEGYYRDSSILISGTAGTGKSTLAAHFADAACRRGERVLYLAFEESPGQITRNMRSVGIDVEPWLRQGLLHFHAVRPTVTGLETHLAIVLKLVRDLSPAAVVVDPITNLVASGTDREVKTTLTRLIDLLKGRKIAALFTSLTAGEAQAEQTAVGVASLMDTWIGLKTIERNGERNRGLYVLKSRGMAHSNQMREFRLGEGGVELVDVYLGPGGVLTGSARHAQEARERAEALARAEALQEKRRDVDRKRAAVEAQITALRTELAGEEAALERLLRQEALREEVQLGEQSEMARLRQADRDDRDAHGRGDSA